MQILSLLLTSGCLIDEVDMQQNTALHQAAVCGHLAMYAFFTPRVYLGRPVLTRRSCRSLLQGGANLLLTNNSGCTVLHLLMGCEVAHEEKPLFRILVNDIIRSFRFNMNARNTAGATALHIASSRGYRWNMKVLLMHNPDINAQSKYALLVCCMARAASSDLLLPFSQEWRYSTAHCCSARRQEDGPVRTLWHRAGDGTAS